MTAVHNDPQPPPPGSLLWSMAGDIRTLLTLPAVMTLQVAHPEVSAGTDARAVFRTDPWGRGRRSLISFQLWVYGGDAAAAEGRRLRRTVRGADARGPARHVLTPAAYVWVHATGYPVFRRGRRYLGRPFTEAQERRLYAEWLQVGRVLGISDGDMPQTVEEFWPYYRKVLENDLEPTPVVRELVSTGLPVPAPDVGPLPLRLLLRVAWPAVRPLFVRCRRFLAIGLLPPDARLAIGLRWSDAQERRLRCFGRVVRVVVPTLPERLRYLPTARRARRAAGGGRGRLAAWRPLRRF
ncbi:oxygenase MpaB family protein [Streptomyces sp. NPDC048644]|uniref:oxygenase MpaB family protein n=1 Tax=Streptomyces sp. NPDC048644 TaxID=3365582 RepID=UPI003724C0AA